MAVYSISAAVDEQNIAIDLGNVQLVSGSDSIYQISFSFSDEWENFTKKVVFYTEWKRSIIEVLLSGTNIVTIPTRSLANSGFLLIGVYGVGTNDEKLPTVWSQKLHIYEGTGQGYENPPAPDPDVYTEILAAMAGKQDILTWDNVPTDGSNNPVKSDGIYDAIKAVDDAKADKNGSYEQLVSGSSDQLLSDNTVTDQSPYNFRKTGGSADILKATREVDSIVGATVCWNQLLTGSRETSSTSTMNYTNISTFKTKMTGTGSSSVMRISANSDIPFVVGHKYLLKWGVLFPTGTKIVLGNSTAYGNTDASTKTEAIINCENVSPTNRFIGLSANGLTLDHEYTLALTDLTAMFGSTIADYVYTLEQNTAGSGIAWLKSYGFFLEPYCAYDAGSLQSVKVSSHKMMGFNQWDEDYALGYWRSDGTFFASNNGYMSSRTPFRVIPNTDYFITIGTGHSFYLAFFDKDGNFISRSSFPYAPISNRKFTIPSNCYYLAFSTYGTYGTTYNHDICVNFSDPAKNETYEPYILHTYPLDSTKEWRGIFKLDANNNLYADGDVYESDGNGVRNYAIVDLGTLTWNKNTAGESPFFYADLSDAYSYSAYICQKYLYASIGATGSDEGIFLTNTSAVRIRDANYISSDATTFGNAMSGVYLVYKIATPTSESANPYDNPQIVDSYGTEEYVDASTTRDFAMPVGHSTKYYENLKAKIEGLPWNFSSLIAPVEETFTATRNYTSGSLFIVNNVLYKATANIANGGTITPNSNATATTLAEVIAAL